jgi:hypothetical protein
MRKDGINPSLVFFDNELQEHQIKKTVEILQGDKSKDEDLVKYQSLLKDINEMLISTTPQLHLMFTNATEYSHDKLPGYICVPFGFDPKALKSYL